MKRVNKKMIEQAIIDANDGDTESVTVAKYDAAVNTKKHCYGRKSNPYFFITFGFKVHIRQGLLPKNFCEEILHMLKKIEEQEVQRCMSTTLINAKASMWFLDLNNNLVKLGCKFLCDEYVRFMEAANNENKRKKREEAINVFKEFVTKGRIPNLVTYLNYEKGEVEGCPPHQDVESIFVQGYFF